MDPKIPVQFPRVLYDGSEITIREEYFKVNA